MGKLSTVFDVPERTLHTILRNAGLQATADGQSIAESAKAAIAFYRGEAKKMDSDAARDRARKTTAEADLAEMERGRVKGTLCLRSDYLDNYADAIAQGVRNVMRIKELSKALREKVFAAIRDVTLPEPSTEK